MNLRNILFGLLLFLHAAESANYGPKWYTCDPSTCSKSCTCASTSPPGSLPPNRTPQFILLTHDDTVHPKSTANIDTLVGGLTHNNGCRLPCTFFVMTNGSDPKTITERWQLGDEIGAHAKTHVNQLDPEVGEQGRISEIVGSRDWILEKTTIPRDHVVGYRTPLLAESVEQRQLLQDAGFLYDSSIVESVKTEDVQRSRVWPYSMDAGVPQNRHRIKKGEEGKERHVGLWEVPVWVLLHQGNRYCMDPGRGGEGNDEEGDPYEILKSNLDAAYDGNRAPIPLYIHVFWFNGEREKRARKFAEYALTKPGVYFVTMQTLIAWMSDPVPIEKMDTWLAERCHGPRTSKKSSSSAKKESSTKQRGEIVQHSGVAGMDGLSSYTSTFTQGGGISTESIALAAASVVMVTAVLTRRRRLRRMARAQK